VEVGVPSWKRDAEEVVLQLDGEGMVIAGGHAGLGAMMADRQWGPRRPASLAKAVGALGGLGPHRLVGVVGDDVLPAAELLLLGLRLLLVPGEHLHQAVELDVLPRDQHLRVAHRLVQLEVRGGRDQLALPRVAGAVGLDHGRGLGHLGHVGAPLVDVEEGERADEEQDADQEALDRLDQVAPLTAHHDLRSPEPMGRRGRLRRRAALLVPLPPRPRPSMISPYVKKVDPRGRGEPGAEICA
jgi:hypothetical protein